MTSIWAKGLVRRKWEGGMLCYGLLLLILLKRWIPMAYEGRWDAVGGWLAGLFSISWDHGMVLYY